MNNLYISPEFEILRVEMIDEVIMSSPENYSSTEPTTIADWGDDPIMDPDDDGLSW